MRKPGNQEGKTRLSIFFMRVSIFAYIAIILAGCWFPEQTDMPAPTPSRAVAIIPSLNPVQETPVPIIPTLSLHPIAQKTPLPTYPGPTLAPGTVFPDTSAIFYPYEISFIDPQHGWAIGHLGSYRKIIPAIRVTSDGGQTWKAVSYPVSVDPLDDMEYASDRFPAHSIRFINVQDGWAYSPRLFVTHDGSQTWAEIQFEPRIDSQRMTVDSGVIDLQFQGNRIWIVRRICTHELECESQVWQSIAKDVWKMLSLPQEMSSSPLILLTLSKQNIVWLLAATYSMRKAHSIWKSGDSGETWQKQGQIIPDDNCLDPQGLYSFEQQLWLVCYGGSGGTQIINKSLFRSTDEGRTWTLKAANQWFGSNFDPKQVSEISGYGRLTAFLMPSHGRILIANVNLMESNDEGFTWKEILPYEDLLEAGGIQEVQFVDPLNGWAFLQYYLFHTTDGGKSWQVGFIR